MRLNENDIQRIKSEKGADAITKMENAIANSASQAEQHPYYSQFKNACQTQLGIAVSDTIMNLWKDLLKGYQEQGGRARAARANASINTISQYLGAINNNAKFVKWVDDICTLCRDALAVPAGKMLALWTGGYAMSQLAQDQGMITLEKTKLGSILNTLPITADWDQEEALWNILSKRFVEDYTGGTVQIYFRNVDDLCVLFQQEIPALKEKRGVEVIWHPIVSNQRGYAEMGCIHKGGRLEFVQVPINDPIPGDTKYRHVNTAFRCKSENLGESCPQFRALEAGLQRAPFQPNAYTWEHFRSEVFHPVHPPFAAGEDPNCGNLVKDFLMKFF